MVLGHTGMAVPGGRPCFGGGAVLVELLLMVDTKGVGIVFKCSGLPAHALFLF